MIETTSYQLQHFKLKKFNIKRVFLNFRAVRKLKKIGQMVLNS